MKNVTATSERLFYLDWVRVLAMFGVFFFHNTRFFDIFADWHIKNATTNMGASVVMAFMVQWIMPLFFLIAGAGTFYALRVRGWAQYAKERALRLLIPLVFGMLVVVVPQAYYQAVRFGYFTGNNFFESYWLYLQTLPDMEWFHLWFLALLFLLSLITIPIMVNWKKGGQSLVTKLAVSFDKPAVLFPALIIPLFAIDAFIYPEGYWGHHDWGGWNVVSYILFFTAGYLVFANHRIMETVQKASWITLGIAMVATASLFGIFIDVLAKPTEYFGTGNYMLAYFVQAVSTWCWLFAILGLAKRFLNTSNRFLNYANEAVLPFYILHQTVIIVIGFYVVQWKQGVGLKYLVISTTSFIVIMAIYELIRRVNVLRFLFGMRLIRKTRPTPT